MQQLISPGRSSTSFIILHCEPTSAVGWSWFSKCPCS